ncbi:MAG: hypothetical protein QNJ97_25145 [Myxococcota bacterium]|nr:hypothetical protein [Myxococcota bacterium]
MSDTRFPTKAELALYRRTKARVDRLSDLADATALLVMNVRIANDFAQNNGLPRRFAELSYFTEFDRLLRNTLKLKAAFDAVEQRELSIRFHNSSEFDVVGPETETPGQYDKYRFGALPLVAVAVAVVIISAVVVTTAALWRSVQKMKTDAQKRTREAERYFCADQSSDVCRRWMETEKKRVDNNKSLSSSLLGGMGMGAGGVGVVAAIALGIWAFSKMGKKHA